MKNNLRLKADTSVFLFFSPAHPFTIIRVNKKILKTHFPAISTVVHVKLQIKAVLYATESIQFKAK